MCQETQPCSQCGRQSIRVVMGSEGVTVICVYCGPLEIRTIQRQQRD